MGGQLGDVVDVLIRPEQATSASGKVEKSGNLMETCKGCSSSSRQEDNV